MRSAPWTLVAALVVSSAPAAARLPNIAAAELAARAAEVPVGTQARFNQLEVEDTAESLDLVLERFEVFAPDAEIVVHGPAGERRMPAPRHAYFRGRVAREPGSHAFLGVQVDGTVQGIVVRGGETYLIDEPPPARGARSGATGETTSGTRASGRVRLRHASAEALAKTSGEGFECAADHGMEAPDPLRDLGLGDPGASPGGGPAPLAEAASTWGVRVAIETDHEFYAKFNSVAKATAYVGNLLGYVSLRYQAEVGAALNVQSLSLWTRSGDPWVQTSTTCGLMEFGRYWNKNKSGVQRTIAHFLSGKSLGGGVAWIGVLCSGAFTASAGCPGLGTDAPWGGAYGFTASVSGGFDPANPRVMWDVVAVAHEIGHNFNSPHTHCYNGLGGSASPVDGCASAQGCYAGSATLPGPAGAGSGTIMSYCHLVRGSWSDIAWSFGTNHAYGTLPGRVPARMAAHLQSRAVSYPSCFASPLAVDGFESGLVPPWDGKTP
jgi:hypothetical protein